jgi:hypothetical protein
VAGVASGGCLDVGCRLTGCQGAIMAGRARTRNGHMVKTNRSPSRHGVALIAFTRHPDMVHRFARAANIVVASCTLCRRRLELTTDVAGFAGDPLVPPFQSEPGRQVIKRRVGFCRGSRRRKPKASAANECQRQQDSQSGPLP